MLKIIQKIWAFTDTRHKELKKGVLVNFMRALFSLCDYFAIYLAISALIEGSIHTTVMIQCAILIIIGVLGRCAMDAISISTLTAVGYNIAKDKRLHVADKLRYIPMGYFKKINLGEITGTLTTTLGDVETIAPMVLVQFISGIIGTTVMALYVLFFDWPVGIAALLAIAVYFFITGLQQKALVNISSLRQKAQASLIFQVLEYLQGIQVIKGFGLFGEKNKAVTQAVAQSCEENIVLNVKTTPWASCQRLTLSLFSVIVCAIAIFQYISGSISLSICLFILVMSFVLFSSLDFAGSSLSLLGLIDISINQVNKIDALPVIKNGKIRTAPAGHNITYENVSFAYEQKEVINHLSAAISSNKITAIVGPSGSGKTTLTHLLARFWDVNAGKIKLNGIDIRDYDYDTLLSQISYVFQDVYLFNDTIENNIGFGRNGASHEEIISAAKKARCHDFIMNLPDHYNTVIKEGGSSLSGGEKQRISIARAILKDAPIIILDEATASVDPENELDIMQAIHELSKNKTCVIIAHRLTTVRGASQILVMANGKVVQCGTHSELINQDGIYRSFIEHKELASQWKL